MLSNFVQARRYKVNDERFVDLVINGFQEEFTGRCVSLFALTIIVLHLHMTISRLRSIGLIRSIVLIGQLEVKALCIQHRSNWTSRMELGNRKRSLVLRLFSGSSVSKEFFIDFILLSLLISFAFNFSDAYITAINTVICIFIYSCQIQVI